MAYFLCQIRSSVPGVLLNPPEDLKDLIEKHRAFWRERIEAGMTTVSAGPVTAIAAGPVMDSNGVWEAVIVEAPRQAVVEDLVSRDPLIASRGQFRCSILDMPWLVRQDAAMPASTPIS